jgi:hypothetical protein
MSLNYRGIYFASAKLPLFFTGGNMSPNLIYILKIINFDDAIKSLLDDFGDLSEVTEHKNMRSWVFTKSVCEFTSSSLAINVISPEEISVHYFLCDAGALLVRNQFAEVAHSDKPFMMASLLQSTLITNCRIPLLRYDVKKVSTRVINSNRQLDLAV